MMTSAFMLLGTDVNKVKQETDKQLTINNSKDITDMSSKIT